MVVPTRFLFFLQLVAVFIATSGQCLWKSQINSMLDYEFNQRQAGPARTCILREGKSSLLAEFQCTKEVETQFGIAIEHVNCKKCMKREDVWAMVRSCDSIEN